MLLLHELAVVCLVVCCVVADELGSCGFGFLRRSYCPSFICSARTSGVGHILFSCCVFFYITVLCSCSTRYGCR